MSTTLLFLSYICATSLADFVIPTYPNGPSWTPQGMDGICGGWGYYCTFVSYLPRLGVEGLVSSDLGQQPLFNCSGSPNGTDRVCSIPLGALAADLSSLLATPEKAIALDFWAGFPGGGYFTGLGVYILLHALAAILLLVWAAALVTGRYVGPYFLPQAWPDSAQCGGADPTRWSRRVYCGFKEYAGGVFAYSPGAKRLAYACVAFTVALLLAMMVLAQVAGNAALSLNLLTLVSPDRGIGQGAAAAIAALSPPLQTLLTSLSTTALAPLLNTLNATLTSTTPGGQQLLLLSSSSLPPSGSPPPLYLPALVADMGCINASFQALPGGAYMGGLLSDYAGSLGAIGVGGRVVNSSFLTLQEVAGRYAAGVTTLAPLLGNISANVNANLTTPFAQALGNASLLRLFKSRAVGEGCNGNAGNAGGTPPLPCTLPYTAIPPFSPVSSWLGQAGGDLKALGALFPPASTISAITGPPPPSFGMFGVGGGGSATPPSAVAGPWGCSGGQLWGWADPRNLTGAGVGGDASYASTAGPPWSSSPYRPGYTYPALFPTGTAFPGGGPATLASALSSLLTTHLAPMPNLEVTARTLEWYNSNISALLSTNPLAPGPIASLAALLKGIQSALAALPPYTSFNATLGAVATLAEGVAFGPAVAASRSVEAAFGSLPPIAPLSAQFRLLSQLTNISSCLTSSLAQLALLNSTLYLLPPSFSILATIASDLGAMGPSLTYLNSQAAAVSGAYGGLSTVNATALRIYLTTVAAAYSGNFAASNITGVPALLRDSYGGVGGLTSLNFAPAIASLASLSTSLAAATIPTLTIARIRALGANLSTLTSAVAYGALEYGAQAKGHCNVSLVLCRGDGDCAPGTPGHTQQGSVGGGYCVAPGVGVRRCARGWFPNPGEWGTNPWGWYPVTPAAAAAAATSTTAPVQMSTNWWLGPFAAGPGTPGTVTLGGAHFCNVDSDCSSGGSTGGGGGGNGGNSAGDAQCLGAYDRAAYLALLLGEVPGWDPAGPIITGVMASLGATNTSLGATDVLGGLLAPLSQGAAAAATLTTLGTITVPPLVANSLGLTGLDYKGVLTAVNTIVSTVTLVPTTTILAVFTSISATLTKFNTFFAPLVWNCATFLSALNYVFVATPTPYVDVLANTTLTLTGASTGSSGLFLALAGVMDAIALDFNARATLPPPPSPYASVLSGGGGGGGVMIAPPPPIPPPFPPLGGLLLGFFPNASAGGGAPITTLPPPFPLITPSTQQGKGVRGDSLSAAIITGLSPYLDAVESTNGFQHSVGAGPFYYLTTVLYPYAALSASLTLAASTAAANGVGSSSTAAAGSTGVSSATAGLSAFTVGGGSVGVWGGGAAMIRSDDPTAFNVFLSSRGTPYAAKAVCLSSPCLTRTLSALNTAPISAIPAALLNSTAASTSASPILSLLTVSRETLLLALWVPALVIAGLGVWAMTAQYCCIPSRWQKVPAAWMVGTAVCWTPCSLLLAALLVPLSMVASDVCGGGANLGLGYVVGMGDALCPSLGGTGGAAACAYNTTVGFTGVYPGSGLPGGGFPVNLTLNLPRIYTALAGAGEKSGGGNVGGCSASDAAYMAGLVASIGTQIAPAIPAFLADILAGDATMCINPGTYNGGVTAAGAASTGAGASAGASNSSSSTTLSLRPAPGTLAYSTRPALATALCAAFAGVGAALPPFTTTLSNTSLSCGGLGGAIKEVRSALCCRVVTPLWLWVAAWVSATWGLLLCGLPGGVWGRKRFTTHPWGPHVLHAAEVAEEEAMALELEKLKATVGMGLFPPPARGGEATAPTGASEATGSGRTSSGGMEGVDMHFSTLGNARASEDGGGGEGGGGGGGSSSSSGGGGGSGSVGGLTTRFVSPKLPSPASPMDATTRTNTELNSGRVLTLPISSPVSAGTPKL